MLSSLPLVRRFQRFPADIVDLSGAGNLADTINYSQCSLKELYEALNSINASKYPENMAALDAEIRSRHGAGYDELMHCRWALKQGVWPEYDEMLSSLIDAAAQNEGIDLANPPYLKYRTFLRRFFAAMLDGMLILIFNTGVNQLFEATGLSSNAALNVYVYVVTVAYPVLMHARFGQTVGKMLTNVKVVNSADEGAIDLRAAVLRDIVPVAAYLVLIVAINVVSTDSVVESAVMVARVQMAYTVVLMIWYIAEFVTMLFNEKRRAVHDYIAKTVVVRT